MSLSQEQLDSVKCWVAEGCSISDVQSKLKDEFDVVMTYMDVRFLIDDLGAELVSVDSSENAELNTTSIDTIESESSVEDDGLESPSDFSSEGDDSYMPSDSELDSTESDGSSSNVKVSVSPIQRPDCVISGEVEFSDGSKAEWRIDRMGQLGIIPESPTMNPPQSDILEFQRQLQQLLR